MANTSVTSLCGIDISTSSSPLTCLLLLSRSSLTLTATRARGLSLSCCTDAADLQRTTDSATECVDWLQYSICHILYRTSATAFFWESSVVQLLSVCPYFNCYIHDSNMASTKNAASKGRAAPSTSAAQRWSMRVLYLAVFYGICSYLNSINVSDIAPIDHI